MAFNDVELDSTTAVRVLPSMHSCTWAADPMPPVDEVCPGEEHLSWQQRRRRLGALAARLADSSDGHHDDWMPGFSRPSDLAPIRRALATTAPATELVEIGYHSGYPLFATD